ncbi:MAG: hypothetical protein C0627_02250 [Sulfurimonas sp.]|nr:MAG: hypothetical protein C0627_02250 [Sulfurimonas sp.]
MEYNLSYNLQLFKTLSILLVEDETILREQTSDLLKIFFFTVFTTSNGLEALGILSEEKIDIVLCDIKMPVMDGLVLTQKIRAKGNTLPIVLISSFSDQKIVLEAANCGIDGYIVKPVELKTLLETFTRVFKAKIPFKSFYQFSKNIVYNVLTEELYKDSAKIDLGKRERSMLKLFMQNPDKTLTKQEIVATIWEMEDVTESALKNLLSRLRKKIGIDVIVSVKGSGWRLKTVE